MDGDMKIKPCPNCSRQCGDLASVCPRCHHRFAAASTSTRHVHGLRCLYETQWVRKGLWKLNCMVLLPDGSTAAMTSAGVISTATDVYTVDRRRMRCGDRDVVRYIARGTYKNMRSMNFSDLTCGREYFLCWRPREGWFDNTQLVMMENDCEIGRYFTPTELREDAYASGDTLALISGISLPVALLILWIGMMANFFESTAS